MSEIDAGSSRRFVHGRTVWCWIVRAVSLAFGLFLLQWLVRNGVSWYEDGGSFDARNVGQLCLASVPVWLAFIGWRWHLATAASLSMVSIVLLGYALLWERHWGGWSERVVDCTGLGSVFLAGAFLVVVAWLMERRSTRDS